MTFLVDNQLPLCRYAEAQARVIISKDEDFLHLASRSDAKIKVVWIRLGNCRTSALIAAFEKFWPTLQSCLDAGDRIVELR